MNKVEEVRVLAAALSEVVNVRILSTEFAKSILTKFLRERGFTEDKKVEKTEAN